MAENAQWYVVHTYSGYENKVAATIEKAVENRKLHDLIIDIRVPTEMVSEIKDNKRVEVERKVYPSYVMLKMVMTDESWHVVRNTRGVTGFVGPASKPVALTEEEVLAMGMEKRELTLDYAVGDNVRICEGPLVDYIGVVTEISMEKNRVKVIISMFGRETPVELELEQVETLDE